MATQAEETRPAAAPGALVPMTPQRERHAILKDQAKMFALSPLIPEHLRKGDFEQTAANCLIAIQMAEAMGEMPLVVMQNIHIINGKAGFAAQYMIARANASGIFTGRINWRITGTGDDLAVTAFATLKETGEEVAFTATMKMAKAEKWTNNAKYTSMPEVMLRYRSAAFLVRFYAPDVMLGYQSSEEIEDVVFAARPAAEPITGQALLAQAEPDAPQPSDPGPTPAGEDAGPANQEPITEAAPKVEKPPLTERMKAVQERAREPEQGRDAADMGETTTLADAVAEIDGCGTVIDVNQHTAALLPLLGEEDADALRNHAMDRIANLGGAA